MKKRQTTRSPKLAVPAPEASRLRWWAGFAGLLLVLFVIYARALHGPLLFDDHILPFGQRQLREAPLRAWISSVRPVLMLSYWLNYQFSGTDTLGYHVLNVLLHAANGLLVFFLFRRLLPGRALWCGFGAAIFLLHPLQTESVAYLAGRSELVVALFLLCSTLVFLRARSTSWRWAAAVTGLLGAALLSKEEALAAIPFFLLLESGWMEGAAELRVTLMRRLREHRRLWGLLLLAGCAGGAWVGIVLAQSRSAGFHVAGRPPLAYFLTECRVLFQYLRLFLFPLGQSMDPHPPVSYNLLDHGAGLYLGALLLAVYLCFRWRRRAPLATAGFLMFLIFLAPTSSFVPLLDPMAEHRMYLPTIGLALMAAELFSRFRGFEQRTVAAMTCVLVILAALTFDRSRVWSSATALAEDAAAAPPLTARSVRMLAQAYLAENRTQEFLERVRSAPPPDMEQNADILTEVGLAMAVAGRDEDAVAKLQRAVSLKEDAFGFGLKGYLEAKLGRTQESLLDLNRAIKLGPDFDAAYGYRGLWYLASNQVDQAIADFQRALSLNPFNPIAREGLEEAARRRGERADSAQSE